MISKDDWNCQNGFDTWWNDPSRELEREDYLNFLSSFLSLDVKFMSELRQTMHQPGVNSLKHHQVENFMANRNLADPKFKVSCLGLCQIEHLQALKFL